jgi:general secretion pathway protein A
MLSRPELRQVAQRVVARYHLTHLTRAEVAGYVTHRLNVSGARAPIFPDSLIGTLYRVTGGVPRLINLVCDRAMLGASVQGKLQVTPKTLRNAAGEVLATSGSGRSRWRRLMGWPLVSAAVLCGGGVFAANLLQFPLWPLDWIVPERPVFGSAPMPQPKLVAAPEASTQAAAGAARAESAVEANPVSAPELPPAADAAAAEKVHLIWPEDTAPRARSEEIAFRDLLRLRGLEYDPGDKRPPCKAVEGLKLRCQHGRGGVADLRRFNQPAVLKIDGGGKGKEFSVVVTGLGENTVTLLVAGEARRVALAEFAQRWSGNAVHLWDVPPGFTDVLMSGSRGPAVPWLRQALARLQGGSADGPAVFDEELQRRVKAFQFSEGMVADGAAGALTLISLNMRLNEKLPRLAPVAGER